MGMQEMLAQGGLIVACLIVYSTTSLFFACLLPSGAVLFSTGVLAATQTSAYPLSGVLALLTVCSIAGSWTGYALGAYVGPALYKRKDSFFYKRRHLDAAAAFYTKYGKLAVSGAYFLPIVRSFSSIFAGITSMNKTAFALGTTFGSLIWVGSFTGAGYLLGITPELKPMLGYIVAFFICAVTVPVVIKIVRSLRSQKIVS